MMRKWNIAILFLLLGWLQPSFGQLFPSQVWHNGYVANDRDTLYGYIKYDLINDVIQFEHKEKTLSFTPKSISFFHFYDELLDSHRQFYSLPYRQGGYSKRIFFELLYGGKVALICREEEIVSRRARNNSYNTGLFYAPKSILEFNYFLLDLKGNIRPYGGKKNELLDLLKPHDAKVRNYINANDLRVNRRVDLIKIFGFYDSLL